MSETTKTTTVPGACGGQARHGTRPEALPIVIRPQPLPLHRLEALLRQDRRVARLLAENPLHLHTLARAVLRRDGVARARFADAEALAAYLHALS